MSFANAFTLDQSKKWLFCRMNPLSDIPILGSSYSTTDKDIISKIWTNGDTIILLSRKHCGKRRNRSLRAISPFPQCFQKLPVVDTSK